MVRIDSATRVIVAAPEVVYFGLMKAEARVAFLPPEGMTGRLEAWDPRPGGGYRLVLSYDDQATPGKSEANTDVVVARFVEIDPPRRVVEEVDFESDDPRFSGTMTMTWTVEADPGGARVTIAASDVPEGITEADHVAGMTSTLANLDYYVVHRRRALDA
jgi:uncharacterized protein YndB with AHSA1/START domain